MSEQSERLLKAILDSKLTYIELEKKTGIAKSSIQRYATGRTQKIPVDAVKLIADATNCSAAWIMGWKENNESEEKVDLTKMTAQEIIEEEYQKLYEKLDLEDKAEIRGTMKQMLKADKYKINTNDTPSLSALRPINNRSDDDGYSQAASNLKYKKKSK